jgi:hypothetical protein
MNNILLLLLTAFIGLSPLGHAKEFNLVDMQPKLIPNVNITEGLETNTIQVNLRMDGSIAKITAPRCNDCLHESFTTDSNTRFYVGNTRISLKEVSLKNGKSGTLVYEPKTKVLVSVQFFDLED